MYTGLGNGYVAAPLPAVARYGGVRGGRGGLVSLAPRPASATTSSLLPSSGEGILPSGASLSAWWSARSTVEKAGIIGGGALALAALAFALQPSPAAPVAPRFGALGPPR